MEINITKFFQDANAFEFSASRMERGDNAGRETWNNALEQASTTPLLNTEQELDAMRQWAKSSGGWDREEIADWTPDEVNALFIQLVSGDMREMENLCSDENGETDWKKYERLAEKGTISGSMYQTTDGEIFYYLGG